MLPHEIDQVCDDYEEQIKTLQHHLKVVKDVLMQIKEVVDNPPNILVNIDIEAKEIGREVRIYTAQGTAAGIGKKIVFKKADDEDLFTKTHAIYEVSIDLKKIIEGR